MTRSKQNLSNTASTAEEPKFFKPPVLRNRKKSVNKKTDQRLQVTLQDTRQDHSNGANAVATVTSISSSHQQGETQNLIINPSDKVAQMARQLQFKTTAANRPKVVVPASKSIITKPSTSSSSLLSTKVSQRSAVERIVSSPPKQAHSQGSTTVNTPIASSSSDKPIFKTSEAILPAVQTVFKLPAYLRVPPINQSISVNSTKQQKNPSAEAVNGDTFHTEQPVYGRKSSPPCIGNPYIPQEPETTSHDKDIHYADDNYSQQSVPLFDQGEVDDAFMEVDIEEGRSKTLQDMIRDIPAMINKTLETYFGSQKFKDLAVAVCTNAIEPLLKRPAGSSGRTSVFEDTDVLMPEPFVSVLHGEKEENWMISYANMNSIVAGRYSQERVRIMMRILFQNNIAELRKHWKKPNYHGQDNERLRFPELFSKFICAAQKKLDVSIFNARQAGQSPSEIHLLEAKVERDTSKEISSNLDYFRRFFDERGIFTGGKRKDSDVEA